MQAKLKLLLLLACLTVPGITRAADNLLLTGAELTTAPSDYWYLGTALPLPGSNLASGFVLHLWADYQTYAYAAGTAEIDARINSLSAAIGYHGGGEDRWWNVRLGAVQSDTRLTPADPGNDSAGVDTNFRLQLEGEKRLSTDFKMVGNFEYIFGRAAHWTRVRLLTRNDDNTYDGPELIYQGDAAYSAFQLGWVLSEIPLNTDWSLGVKAGFRFDENDTAVYSGVELVIPY